MKAKILSLVLIMTSLIVWGQTVPNIRENLVQKTNLKPIKKDSVDIRKIIEQHIGAKMFIDASKEFQFKIIDKNRTDLEGNVINTSTEEDSILETYNKLLTLDNNGQLTVADTPSDDSEMAVRAMISLLSTEELTRYPQYYPYFKQKVKNIRDTISDIRDTISALKKEKATSVIKRITWNKKLRASKELRTQLKSQRNAVAAGVEAQVLFPTFIIKGRANTFNSIFSKENDASLYLANSASLQLNDNGGIVQSELLEAYLGPLRISLGTTITNAQSDDNDQDSDAAGNTTSDDEMMEPAPVEESATPTDETQAFLRLLTGGGNTYLNIEFPMVFHKDERFFFYLNANAKLAAEIAELSGDVDTTTGNGSFSSNLYSSISTDNDEFNFFVDLNFGYYFGGSAFYERLDIQDDNGFTFGQFTAGVNILKSIQLSLTLNTFGSESNLNSGTILVGTKLLSDLFKKKDQS